MNNVKLPKVVFFSDTHLHNSLPYIAESFSNSNLFSLGDLNVRYAKGRDWDNELIGRIRRNNNLGKQRAIDYAAEHCPGELFRELDRGSVSTRVAMYKLDRLRDQGKSFEIPNVGGNSPGGWSMAFADLGSRFGLNVDTPESYLKNSRTLKHLSRVDYEVIGDSFIVMMPYTTDERDWELFEGDLVDIVKGIRRYNPKEVIFATHEHADPEGVFSPEEGFRPVKMKEILDLYLSVLPEVARDANVSFVAGHVHRFVEPYQLENGVTVYTTGWDEGTNKMRVLVLDPETGEKKYVDLSIDLSEEESDLLESLVERELTDKRYITEVRHQNGEDDPECEEQEEGEDSDSD